MEKKVVDITEKEKAMIKAINFICSYDGIIRDDSDIVFLLKESIRNLIPKRRQHLFKVDENSYPIKIKY
jgi:hypothetical protein